MFGINPARFAFAQNGTYKLAAALPIHTGPVMCAEFSERDGLLATAGTICYPHSALMGSVG
jgi:hypothetical protein